MRVALAVAVIALSGGCVLLSGVGDLSIEDDRASTDAGAATTAESGATGTDAEVDVDGPIVLADSGTDAFVGDGSTCRCDGLVSAYTFADPNALGHDALGKNNMVTVLGAPKQSGAVPDAMHGHSIELDGTSAVCIESAYTFDATQDHTLCWWSQPTALGNGTNQFAQTCSYDSWTGSDGLDYVWRINNCDDGVANEVVATKAYAVNQWVQICQTYRRSTLLRTVVVDGKTDKKASVTDTAPILDPQNPWCIGAYGGNGPGGFWKGLIYLPMWWNRILDDAEIQTIMAKTCCLPP